MSGSDTMVEMLSEMEGVDVNIGDKEGNTPLIFAAQAGKSKATSLIFAQQVSNGKTPLIFAV